MVAEPPRKSEKTNEGQALSKHTVNRARHNKVWARNKVSIFVVTA